MLHGPASWHPREIARWLRDGSRARLSALLYRSRWTPDAIILARRFHATVGRPINWTAPRTFTEKIYWQMRYARDPRMPQLADKVAVRDFVVARGAGAHLARCYGVWKRVAEVPFAALPPTFVLKVAWGSGMNLICHDPAAFDIARAKATLTAWAQRNHYWNHREWAYKSIRPRILAEELLLDASGQIPEDYKFFCFDGVPRLIQVDRDRFTRHTQNFYTPDWTLLPVRCKHPPGEPMLPRPASLPTMLALAGTLSADFPFVRVDLYALPDRVVFGEMTWYPQAGTATFEPARYEDEFGAWLRVPHS